MRAGVFSWLAAVCAALLWACIASLAPLILGHLRIDATHDQRNTMRAATAAVLADLPVPAALILHTAEGVAWNADDIARWRWATAEATRIAGARLAIHTETSGADAAAAVSLRPLIGAPIPRQTLSDALRADPDAVIGALVRRARPATPLHVALITSVPADVFSGDPQTPAFIVELAKQARLKVLPRDFSAIDADVDVVAILHPWAMTSQQADAVAAFVARRGRAFVAVDPAFLAAADLDRWRTPAQTPERSSLAPLLSAFGVAVSPDVVLDLDAALPVQSVGTDGAATTTPQPLYWRAEPAPSAGVSAGVNVAAAGAVATTPTPGLQTQVLLHSSSRTGRMVAFEALQRPSPTRTLQAAFDQGEIALAVRVLRAATAETAALDMTVIADADFLLDRYYREGAGAQARVLADNAAFAARAIIGGADLNDDPQPRRPQTGAPDALSWPVWIAAAPGPLALVLWLMIALLRRRA